MSGKRSRQDEPRDDDEDEHPPLSDSEDDQVQTNRYVDPDYVDPDYVVPDEAVGDHPLGDMFGNSDHHDANLFSPDADRFYFIGSGTSTWGGVGPRRRDRVFLRGVPANRRRAFMDDSVHSPDSQQSGMLGPDLGTMNVDLRQFPSSSYSGVSDLDLDYQLVHMHIESIGYSVFEEGFDELCWTLPQIRGGLTELGIKDGEQHLSVARGPGILMATYNPWPNGEPADEDRQRDERRDPRKLILDHLRTNRGPDCFLNTKIELLVRAPHMIAAPHPERCPGCCWSGAADLAKLGHEVQVG